MTGSTVEKRDPNGAKGPAPVAISSGIS